MRMRSEEIERAAALVARRLLEHGGVTAEGGAAALAQAASAAIRADLAAEAKLDEEVKDLLAAKSRDLERAGAEYQKMFDLVKRELARKRHLVL